MQLDFKNKQLEASFSYAFESESSVFSSCKVAGSQLEACWDDVFAQTSFESGFSIDFDIYS